MVKLKCIGSVLKLLVFFTYLVIVGSSEVRGDALVHQPPEKIPSNIAKAWDSTFLLFSASDSTYTVGGAFVTKVIQNHGSRTIYFASSNHLVSDGCRLKAVCYGLRLYQDIKVLPTENDFGHIRRFSSGASFSDVEIVKRDVKQDLIFLKVTSNDSDSKIAIEPLDFEDSCELKKASKVYVIGFPQTSVEPIDPKHPISDKEFVRKRWNQGLYLNLVEMDEGKSPTLAGTTNMVLNGSSGCPLISDRGRIVGMVEQGTAGPMNHYQYTGNEDPKNYDWSATSTTCSDLKSFLKGAM